MHDPPSILIVDVYETNRDILATQGYDLCHYRWPGGARCNDNTASRPHSSRFHDAETQRYRGIRLKGDAALPFMSIIRVTAKTDTTDVVAGLDAGADARVRSTLRLTALHDRVLAQTAELASWNQPPRATGRRTSCRDRAHQALTALSAAPDREARVSSGDERMLESHRRQVTVLFCDLRGFTAFSFRARGGDAGAARAFGGLTAPLPADKDSVPNQSPKPKMHVRKARYDLL
jgi:adenylate cyclase